METLQINERNYGSLHVSHEHHVLQQHHPTGLRAMMDVFLYRDVSTAAASHMRLLSMRNVASLTEGLSI